MQAVNSASATATASENIVRMRKVKKTPRNPRTGKELLSISSNSEDHNTLRRILLETHWHVAAVGSCRRARTILNRQPISVIVCERDLPDGTWRDIMTLFADANRPPLVIVTSRLADDRLWAEVLNLGGYDVLAKPFYEQEVRHVLTSAGDQSGRYPCAAGIG